MHVQNSWFVMFCFRFFFFCSVSLLQMRWDPGWIRAMDTFLPRISCTCFTTINGGCDIDPWVILRGKSQGVKYAYAHPARTGRGYEYVLTTEIHTYIYWMFSCTFHGMLQFFRNSRISIFPPNMNFASFPKNGSWIEFECQLVVWNISVKYGYGTAVFNYSFYDSSIFVFSYR